MHKMLPLLGLATTSSRPYGGFQRLTPPLPLWDWCPSGPPNFQENTNSAEALRSTGVTPLPRYYDPLRLPNGPERRLFIPDAGCLTPHQGRLPERVSQVPRWVSRYPPSPITPESPTAALARYFAVDSRLRPFRKASHSQIKALTRPNRVHTHVTADIVASPGFDGTVTRDAAG